MRTQPDGGCPGSWQVFERVACEPLRALGGVQWFTWSERARSIVRAFADRADALPEPTQLRVVGQGLYAVSYHLETCAELDELEPSLRGVARQLRAVTLPESRLMLLTDMFDDRVDGPVVHKLWSRLRAIMASEAPGCPALHAPIAACSVLRSSFPPHADLFPAVGLLAVFVEVPDDDSGASLLLSFARFEAVLDSVESLPAEIRAQIRRVCRRDAVDSYDEFIDLLYRPSHPWRDELIEALSRVWHRIKLDPGQGYLLDDRRWLHGREMQSCPVSVNRLYRLVFSSTSEGDAGP